MNGNQTRPWVGALALAVAVAAAFGLGAAVRQALPLGPAAVQADEAAPAADYAGPWATAERQIAGDEERGTIRVGEQNVLQIQTSAGGLTGYERAVIVAKRLNDALSAGTKPDQVHAVQISGMSVLQAGNIVLITVNSTEAERQNTTVAGLAGTWAQAIGQALGGQPAPPVTPPPITPATAPTTPEGTPDATPVEGDWTPPEPYKDKIVPIISVLEGVKLGAARVNGPTSKVDLVQAVAQLETNYERVLGISLYVPISTEVPGSKLARVQGVGVTALADIRIR